MKRFLPKRSAALVLLLDIEQNRAARRNRMARAFVWIIARIVARRGGIELPQSLPRAAPKMYVPFAVDDVVPAARYVSRATADSRLAAKLRESRRASRVGKRVCGKQETVCSATGDKLRDASALPDDILRRTVVEDIHSRVDKRALKPKHHRPGIEHELVARGGKLLLRAFLVDPRAVRLRG